MKKWNDPEVEEELKLYQVSVQYRRDHSYHPEVAAFDIETSRQGDIAFMYIWQMAIGDLVVYGRTWTEFRQWLQLVREVLSLTYDFRLVIYDHLLKYEFAFMHRLVIVEEKNFIAKSCRTVMQCTIQGAFDFRDSYVYTERSLEKLGDLVGLPKLKDLDYSKTRTEKTELSAAELDYCARDVQILVKYFRQEREFYGAIGKIPLTLSQKVTRILSSNLYANAGESQRIKYRIINSQLNFNNEEDRLVLNRLRIAFFGAYNFSAPLYRDEILEDVYNADISMSYGSQMLLHKFPRGKFTALPIPQDIPEGKEDQALRDMLNGKIRGYRGMALLIRVEIGQLRAKYPSLAFLPVPQKNYFGRSIELRKRMHFNRIAQADHVDLCLTDIDMRLLLMFYEVKGIKIKEVYGSRYEQLPEYILQSIVQLAADKKIKGDELKAIKAAGKKPSRAQEEEYNLTKSMVSRIYGVFVQDPIRQKYEYSNVSGSISPNGFLNAFAATEDARKNRQLYRPVLYQWGVWVASWARWEFINMVYALAVKNKRLNNHVLYGDTDGITWHNHPEAEKIIAKYNEAIREKMRIFCDRYGYPFEILAGCGEYKIEKYRYFKTTGQKQYCFIDSSGKFDYHVSGLQRENWQEDEDGELHNVGMQFFDQWKDPLEKMRHFKENMEIPADISNTLRAHYCEEKTVLHNVEDYQGNITEEIEVPSCMILKPVDFKMQSDFKAAIVAALSDKDKLNEYIHKNGLEAE